MNSLLLRLVQKTPVRSGSTRFTLKQAGTTANMVGNRCSLIATIPVTEHIKNEFNSAGDSQLLEDSVNVIPDRVFLHPQPLSDLTVLQAIREIA